MTKLTIIAAMDSNRGIGLENQLPWKIAEDLQHFKRTTLDHTIVMGRRTFDSIGRPLPKRHNIVVTRNRGWDAEGVSTFFSPEEVLSYLRNAQTENAFIIGGTEIYKEFFPLADRMILTEIQSTFKCDAYFPDFYKGPWKEVSRVSNYSTDYNCSFDFVEYHRIE